MTALGKQTSRLRRAALIGALITVPLAPLTGCGGGDDSGGSSGGGADSEQSDGGGEDDGGGY